MNEDIHSSVLAVLSGEAVSPPPVWMMRQAGRYLPEYREVRAKTGSFWSMCMDPKCAAEITLQPLRRFGLDAAILFSDILVVPYAMGRAVDFDNGSPRLDAITCAAELDADERNWKERLEPVYKCIRAVKSELPENVALLGFAGAPWTLATYLAQGAGSTDQRAAKLWGYRDPSGFKSLLEGIANCVAFHLRQQIEAGADAVQIFDSWAGGLPPRAFSEWVVEPTHRIISQIRTKHPQSKIIGFPRAATLAGYIQYALETGIDGISLDSSVPMDWAAEALPANVAIQGNLDPVALVAGGPAMLDAANAILAAMQGRRFVFNLGHGVLPETPVENVQKLVNMVRRR